MSAPRTPVKARPLLLAFAVFLAAAPLAGAARANDRAGLWVGAATVNAVSQVNRAIPDLSFDLALTAFRDASGAAPAEEEVLVAPNAFRWKYTPHTASSTPYGAPAADYLGRPWNGTSYNDIDWAEDQARLGFGNGGEKTVLSYNAAAWPRTYYFRKGFRPSATGFDRLRVELLRDDGAVVYVNGVEVLRSNLPAGLIGYDTPPVTAVGPSEEGRYVVSEIDLAQFPGLLQDGSNTVAVEVHQHPSEVAGPGQPASAVTSSPTTFDLRVLLHSDSQSATRLLKEVYPMLGVEGTQRVPVLVADDRRVPDFQGTGRRISTAAYDFVGPTLSCTGAVGSTGTVECVLVLGPNHPTNPFLHRYHPDHDNWDARYEKHFPEDAGAREESFGVRRTLTFSFDSRFPPGCEGSACRQFPPPGWGSSILGGTYREVLTGLHRDDITVTGTFRLDRVSPVDHLEP